MHTVISSLDSMKEQLEYEPGKAWSLLFLREESVSMAAFVEPASQKLS